ncbi:hypothetical protein WCT82_16050 [Pectobacterium carotovorum]
MTSDLSRGRQWWLDADARVIRERDMAGTGTHYSYDEDGHCIAIREGENRHFLYDGRGLLIKEPRRTIPCITAITPQDGLYVSRWFSRATDRRSGTTAGTAVTSSES